MLRRLFLLLAIFCIFSQVLSAATSFYRENRNGKVFVLQVDPDTGIETVFNAQKSKIFLAPGAKRLSVIPTAGWGDYTSNKDPLGNSLAPGEQPGDSRGIITLRQGSNPAKVIYEIYSGTTKIHSIEDTSRTVFPDNFDVSCSQFVGKNRNVLRVYLYLSAYKNWGPTLFRFEFDNFVLQNARYKNSNSSQTQNWQAANVLESGSMGSAQTIEINAAGSDEKDLVVYEPSRKYSLQHLWDASKNSGVWGINYLMTDNHVFKAKPLNPLTSAEANMNDIFDVSVDLGNSYIDTIQYIRSYYNIGLTFVWLNHNTNATFNNIRYDVRDPVGQDVEVRSGSYSGAVIDTCKINPNPAILGHNITALFGLSCKNALSGKKLIVYEPVYKLNQAAIDENEFTDNNKNNVPDNFDTDGKGYWGYRTNLLIDINAGSSLSSDYVLDFVIAHEFDLTGKTANDEFTYQELAVERRPVADKAKPSEFIPGAVVHIRIGNIWHRDPDVYGEYGQFGWNSSPGNSIFFYVSNPGNGYNTQNTALIRNSGKILGVEVLGTSNATADYFGVVGNDDWASGQGDLYFLSRKYGEYINPRIVQSNTTLVPPCTGYGLWWKYQYERKTFYGSSRTYWISSLPYTEWINDDSFFIGNSVYSQKVYTVNCGCRGLRYDNFQLEKEASSPILDFAIVNIGAPPYLDGTIAPTIAANTGSTVIKPNTPVSFTGSYADPVGLIDPATVKFRYVILNNSFNDTDPSTDSKLVIDSLVETGDYLSSPNWMYVFKDSDLAGSKVATFTVYLGIKFKYQDYNSLPYPAYSWWPIPMTEKFAWSNSNGGSYYDGQMHGFFGAPLRITVNTISALTPDKPLLITSVSANTNKCSTSTDFRSGQVKGDQNTAIRLKIDGKFRYLSEIPEPKESNYQKMGGIMPWPYGNPGVLNHYRVSLDAAGYQHNYATSLGLSSDEFSLDNRGIEYGIYVKSRINTKTGEKGYTSTVPANILKHLLYDGATLASIEGWQEIGSGTLDQFYNQHYHPIFTDEKPNVSLTPRGDASGIRTFDFSLVTPVFKLPVPLDNGNDGNPLGDYQIKVAFRYPIGGWSQVEVENYDYSQIVKSYNCNKTQDQTITSDTLPESKNVKLRILDTEGPALEAFDFEVAASSGDPMPGSDKNLRMVDNNPHDYIKRGSFPALRFAYGIGKDKYLNIQNEDGDSPTDPGLGFSLGKYDVPGNFDISINTQSSGEQNWASVAGTILSSYSVEISAFPGLCRVTYEPVARKFLAANSLYQSAFNANLFNSKWYLYGGPVPPYSENPDDYQIFDGSANLLDFSRSVYKGTTQVYNNDCPNMRVVLSDSANLMLMIEVRNGIKDGSATMATRKIKISNLKNNTSLFEGRYQSDKTLLSVMTAPLIETYSLASLVTAPAGITVLTPFTGELPVKIIADSRFKITGEAYDNAGVSTVGVTFSINDPKINLGGSDKVSYIFRGGQEGQSYTITATSEDDAKNKVILEIPVIIISAKDFNIRTIEENIKKQR
ncbi:MAG: hypothetical protein KKB51_15165 [Candidatus Riflebacteria bacterium]|nr:hypothetical protein [Candidatus Riflebacteria bacterium]